MLEEDVRYDENYCCCVLSLCAGTSGNANAQEVINMRINDLPVVVEWENNKSVNALRDILPLTVKMSMYGGFEQVGSLGRKLPRDDKRITTSAGDIMLYSGNQIVVFYGSNTWAYTRLGRITGKTASELAELLGNSDVTITLSAD